MELHYHSAGLRDTSALQFKNCEDNQADPNSVGHSNFSIPYQRSGAGAGARLRASSFCLEAASKSEVPIQGSDTLGSLFKMTSSYRRGGRAPKQEANVKWLARTNRLVKEMPVLHQHLSGETTWVMIQPRSCLFSCRDQLMPPSLG